MRVAVIGAGIAGLVAARDLTAGGHEVVVIEKSRGLGGRMAARRVEGMVLDHGLPVLEVPSGGVLAGLVRDLAADGLVHLDGDAVAWPAGMTVLPKAMAGAVEVLLGTRVSALRESGEGIEIAQDQGNTISMVDAVVITAPAPQAVELLATLPDAVARVDALRAVEYDPAVMVLAGLSIDEPGWLAARPDSAPIAYVINEAVKGRAPIDGVIPVVIRLRPDDSARLFDAPDDTVLGEVLPALAGVMGHAAPTVWTQVKRWRYATARTRIDQEVVNPAGSRVIIAGDAVAAGPGIEDVARTGQWAARRLLSR
ncbi:MAG: NAD(P)/FAD-dependent oxidoreductase [Miltoncostaeaceae bacterium]